MAVLTISYFAKTREQMGRDEDSIDFPDHVRSINDAIEYLIGLGDDYRIALGERSRLRFALDNQMVVGDAIIAGARELAIFPPVTGG